jgi:hypothetical protein
MTRDAADPVTSEAAWAAVGKASFAVISYDTPKGEPRSCGVVYGVHGHRLYVAIAADSWKARHIKDGQQIAVTVPVRRGGLLSLLVPIPPATVSFHARATVHPAGSLDLRALSERLASLLPAEHRDDAVVLELVPEGTFVTYGIGVTLRQMADARVAGGHAPVV